MRNLLFTAAVLLSSAAFGQFGSQVQVTVQSATNTASLSVGPSQCGSTSTFNWRVAGTPCTELSLWITTDTDCRDSASAQTSGSTRSLSSIPLTTITSSGGTATATFQVSNLPIFSTSGSDAGTGSCGDPGIESTMRLCAATKTADALGSCSSNVVKAAKPLEITYDTKSPDAPSISGVAALDKALKVTVDAPEDALQVKVVALLAGVEVSNEQQGVAAGAVRVANLQNDVTYQLEAYAIDEAGNQSPASVASEGTPTRTFGFYERYREAGGEETGCGATGGGFAGGGMLAALGFWLFSRRNRS
ncbi:MAG TPA: MXAN_2561 family MXYO-CTERM-anchored protein [Archangium sp.]|uniref:MXAN_2561 family MXYO-CTERM-anchored protein n=1 Tax=Archangium sp. TaxID=1872627 RepID=UPI002E36F9B3|nr:MXAN_2561 family MXYO-CTERM-anchored protein [Archangium sp.]HEX5751459.1 MXAN_2561 family MXYO-CTERM-anchored protein [Archangium sp.]